SCSNFASVLLVLSPQRRQILQGLCMCSGLRAFVSAVCIWSIAITWSFHARAQGFDLFKFFEQGVSGQNKEVEDFKRLIASLKGHLAARRHAQALPLARRVVSIIEKEVGPTHPAMDEPLLVLGLLLKELN